MPLTFLCPRVKFDGCKIEFSFSSKNQALFLKFFEQHNDGTYGPNHHTISLSMEELAEILMICQKREGEFQTIHKFNDHQTNIQFLVSQKTNNIGFIICNGTFDCYATLTNGQRIQLILFLQFFFNRVFTAIYSEDKKIFGQTLKNKDNKEEEKELEAKTD